MCLSSEMVSKRLSAYEISYNTMMIGKVSANSLLNKEHENAMPLRFGSALFSKLKKKYWELPHVAGNPLV